MVGLKSGRRWGRRVGDEGRAAGLGAWEKTVELERSFVASRGTGTVQEMMAGLSLGKGKRHNSFPEDVRDSEVSLEEDVVRLLRKQTACLAEVVGVKQGRIGRIFVPWEPFFVKVTPGGYLLLMDPSAEEFEDGRVLAMHCLSGCEVAPARGCLVKIRKRGNKEKVFLRLPTELIANTWATRLQLLSKKKVVGLSDFQVLGAIGKGAHGSVFLVRERKSDCRLAMKVVSKAHTKSSEKNYEHALNERLILEVVKDDPHFVQLQYAFQTKDNFYLLTDFLEGGDLFEYQRRNGPWRDFAQLKIIVAELVSALEVLHRKNVVYRDLKPENVMIHRDGHIRLADLGLAKLLEHKIGNLTNTICGTTEFAAPEILDERSYGLTVDIYALGVFLYVLLHANMPFAASDYGSKDPCTVKFDLEVPEDAKNLCISLLQVDPMQRLGCGMGGIADVRRHPFFKDVNWNNLRSEPAPFEGLVNSVDVSTHFDSMSVCKVDLLDRDEDFSYSDGAIWPLQKPSLETVPEQFVPGYSYSPNVTSTISVEKP